MKRRGFLGAVAAAVGLGVLAKKAEVDQPNQWDGDFQEGWGLATYGESQRTITAIDYENGIVTYDYAQTP